MSLLEEEAKRYARHLNLPGFDTQTQTKLKHASVLVVGAGGLGAPILQYLTAAGVGRIGVADADTVDESNLQRQVLFRTEDIGRQKSQTVIQQLERLNPFVTFDEHALFLNASNAVDIMEAYDVIVDGTDNLPTRYLINDACALLRKPWVYGSIYQYEGQVSVFNFQDGPTYRDLFPTPPPPELVPDCAAGGVLGVLPGIIGSMQASEVIKILTGIGEPLSGRLLLFDALAFSTRFLNIKKDPKNPISSGSRSDIELIDYDAFCGLPTISTSPSISVGKLKEMMDNYTAFTLIDVRETFEYKAANLGGLSIPVSDIEQNLNKVPNEGIVVVHCKTGKRSAHVISLLSQHHGYQNLINLEGGIMAWKAHFAPEMPVL